MFFFYLANKSQFSTSRAAVRRGFLRDIMKDATVEAQSCDPRNQRLSNYQNKSCKSYVFSFNYLKGKCANLNHSNIDIGGQGAKTSKSVIRRGDISLFFSCIAERARGIVGQLSDISSRARQLLS